MYFRSAFISIIAVLLLSACSTKTAEVTLRDMQLAEMGIFETGVDIVFRVHNPLSEPLKIIGARYSLEIEGLALGRGSSNESFEVPALDSSEQRVRFYLSNFVMFQRIQSMMQSQEVNYKLDGELLLAGRSSMSVRENGVVDFAFTRTQPAF